MQKPVDPQTNELIILGLFAFFSGCGGIVGYMSRTMQTEAKINPLRALFEGISAAFIGLVVTLLCEAIHLNMCWTGAFVGVSGWIGATASVKIIEVLLYRKLGVDTKSDEGKE